jgi:hypothetical protein
MERNAEQKKPDLKTVPVWPWRYAQGQKRHAVFLSNE